MNSFKNREEAVEAKFAHDEELRFKASARRNKLLGLWAAEKMGLSGSAASDYARSVVLSDFQEAGDEDVFRKIRGDFDERNISQSDQEIRCAMDDLMVEAMRQMTAGE